MSTQTENGRSGQSALTSRGTGSIPASMGSDAVMQLIEAFTSLAARYGATSGYARTPPAGKGEAQATHTRSRPRVTYASHAGRATRREDARGQPDLESASSVNVGAHSLGASPPCSCDGQLAASPGPGTASRPRRRLAHLTTSATVYSSRKRRWIGEPFRQQRARSQGFSSGQRPTTVPGVRSLTWPNGGAGPTALTRDRARGPYVSLMPALSAFVTTVPWGSGG